MEPLRPLHKRILRWGNSYGIRLTKEDLAQIGMHPDEDVDVKVERCAPSVDWSHLPLLSLGPHASLRHDQILAETGETGDGADSDDPTDDEPDDDDPMADRDEENRRRPEADP